MVKGLTFTYTGEYIPALQEISFSLKEGEFTTLCGASGSGKSTLLRQFKAAIAPKGLCSGEILLQGKSTKDLDFRQQSQWIGYVSQSPEHQFVTDKVWHELAFGLESLGMASEKIRSRVAEMASFFGIEQWFHQEVSTLSGGQKQLVNLASVMMLEPKLLILD